MPEAVAVDVSALPLTDHDRYLQISVNGGPAVSVRRGACGATVQLAAGTNSIKLFNSLSAAPNSTGSPSPGRHSGQVAPRATKTTPMAVNSAPRPATRAVTCQAW
ncbi:hypothetical protein GCM10009682_58360 [Luedemannella flava]|uniref:Uncharacterized protein n=1 Tax=Luedemannella flava TaxID=349316 RepID=A0ABN2MN78_9ACTN